MPFEWTAAELNQYNTADMENGVENVVEIDGSPRHFKMMCNVMVNGKRSRTNSKTSKSIVAACVRGGIHIADAYGENGEVWNCVGESEAVRVGDIAHMYHGDMDKGNSKHFVGEVLSTPGLAPGVGVAGRGAYVKSKWETRSMAWVDDLQRLWDVWPGCGLKRVIYCRVAWKEVEMTAEDEDML